MVFYTVLRKNHRDQPAHRLTVTDVTDKARTLMWLTKPAHRLTVTDVTD